MCAYLFLTFLVSFVFYFRIFPVLWKVARSFLDHKTRNKCIVLGVTEQDQLLDYFNPEDLPEEYGGTCRCGNGCLPEVPRHMVNSLT